MPDDYFGDEPATATAPRPPSPDQPPAESDREEEGERTALLPKSFFAPEDLEVGYRCTVEITAIHDEEVSVTYEGSAQASEEDEAAEARDSESPDLAGPGGPPPGAGGMGGYMD